MRKIGILTAAAAVALGASIQVSAAPASKTIIEDPVGDANFINDQGTGDGSFGDHTAADAGTVSDLMEVQLSNDAKNLIVTFVTEAPPPASTGIGYRLRVNPDETTGRHCIRIEVYYPGANNVLTTPKAQFVDDCEGGEATELEVLGTQVIVPRSVSKALAKGGVLTAPQAQSFLYTGDYPNGAPTGTADTTKVGTDYKMVDKKKKR